jgi:hypothetical protein
MTPADFARKLQASIYVQMKQAKVDGIVTHWTEHENVFSMSVANGKVLKIRCYQGDDKLCALVDVEYTSGRMATWQLYHRRKRDTTVNPEVTDALGIRLKFSDLVE